MTLVFLLITDGMQASTSKSKIDDITKSLYSEADKQEQAKSKRKLIERSLMLLALIGTVAVVILFGDVLSRMQKAATPKSMIYGTWVEQKVAHYATDVFVLNEHGVSIAGSIVATDFSFDGRYFEYSGADKSYRFKMINAENTEMILDSDGYYNPTFRRQDSQTNALR